MPQLGTDTEINQQTSMKYIAEVDLMKATLRLRALKGEALMQNGDSWHAHEMNMYMGELAKEFGNRNLRAF